MDETANLRSSFPDAKRKKAEDQIDQHRKPIEYDTTEYPVEVIITKINQNEPWKADWFIPNYQRQFIWHEGLQSKFIESVILNIPIPFMFLAQLADGRFEIVDGSQRIRTLQAFCNNELVLEKLSKLTELEGFRYCDLTEAEQRKFNSRTLRIIRLSERADESIRQDLFNRVNTCGARLVEPESRRGSFDGKYYDFVKECSRNGQFLVLCPFSEKRKKRWEPEEYVLRYLCYKDKYRDFKHDVRGFLDEYVVQRNASFNEEEVVHDRNEFQEMLEFASKYLPYGFKRSESAQTSARVRFEALSVGITLALRKKKNLTPKNLDWVESKEFEEMITSDASNSPKKLQGRIEFVRDRLLA